MERETEIFIGEKIDEILRKYGLGSGDFFDNPEIEKIYEKAKTKEEILKAFKDLPFEKMLDLALQAKEGKVTREEFPKEIQKRLKISEFLAQKIAKELEEFIFGEVKIKKEEIKKDVYREPIE